MGKGNLIYIYGGGRSGTTILATLLGNSSNITTVGEMHQFPDHFMGNEICACNKNLNECNFWKAIYQDLTVYKKNIKFLKDLNSRLESHINILPLLLGIYNRATLFQYLEFQKDIFDSISKKTNKKYILDSAKYISRGILLGKMKGYDIKYIYMVREVRGVVSSFSKNVQTQKKPWLSYLYYNLINLFGEIYYRLLPENQVIKIKYEDLMRDPNVQLAELEDFLGVSLGELKNIIQNDGFLEMPHLIGGNRIRKSQKIKFKKDPLFKYQTSLYELLLYLMSYPLMKINGYKFKL